MLPRPEPPATAGFTLVETLIALALLTMALLATAQLVVQSRRSLESAAAAARAQRQTDALVETLQMLPPEHPWLSDGVRLTPAAAGTRLAAQVRPWPGDENLLWLQVTARWAGSASRPGVYRLNAVRRRWSQP